MSDHSVPILLNHDHTKQVGVFEAGIVTFLPDHRPTKEEFFSTFGNVGFRVMEQFIDRDGTVRIGTAEIHEFSVGSRAMPRNDKAWDDSEVYSAEYSPRVRFSPDLRPEDMRGLSIGGDEVQWLVSWEQLQAWGLKGGDELSLVEEGPALCYVEINGVRVAKGERSPDGRSCSWTQIEV